MIKQSRPEGKAEEVEIEMTDFAPGSPVAGSPFWNKDMDVRIPLEITAKGVKDSDETGGEVFRAVHFWKKAQNDIPDGMEKIREQRAILQKENA